MFIFSLVLRTCMVFDLATCIWAMIGTHVNLNVLMILVIHNDHYSTLHIRTYIYCTRFNPNILYSQQLASSFVVL